MDLLCNGAFWPGLWTRRQGSETVPLACPTAAHTFCADRWHVRYAAPRGGMVAQRQSGEMPPGSSVECSLEIQGGEGVGEPVLVGQNIEAADAPAYRRPLRFTAWCFVEHPERRDCLVRFVAASPCTRDVFDSSLETHFESEEASLPSGTWTRLDFAFDATTARPLGLQIALQFSNAFLSHPAARVRLADASLYPSEFPQPSRNSWAVESSLAHRYFQRHDGHSTNAIGRALVCNEHELHFQFTFPEMRAFPSVTLPQDNEDLTVFTADGIAQSGFSYDVTFRSRGSAIIRASKSKHRLRDGYLAFRGYRGAILLEAEL